MTRIVGFAKHVVEQLGEPQTRCLLANLRLLCAAGTTKNRTQITSALVTAFVDPHPLGNGRVNARCYRQKVALKDFQLRAAIQFAWNHFAWVKSQLEALCFIEQLE
jgi:hypothetical protein